MADVKKVAYCTTNKFKQEEWEILLSQLREESPLGETLAVDFRPAKTDEPLNRNLEEMVRAKAASAYSSLLVPCIVEHAGLVLSDCTDKHYPGGLTQPMWDALGAESFVKTCCVLSNRVLARAVVGYCDGERVYTLVGETSGILIEQPRGDRSFYWDTVFCPDGGHGRTYAEIVGVGSSGLAEKLKLSQSAIALRKFIEFLRSQRGNLFP